MYIFDHGKGENNASDQRQQIGDKWLGATDPIWLYMAEHISEEGTFHLRGCGVASFSTGKEYIRELALWTQRNITAFDRDVQHNPSWIEDFGPDYWSRGNLLLADPSGSLKILHRGGWWRSSGFFHNFY